MKAYCYKMPEDRDRYLTEQGGKQMSEQKRLREALKRDFRKLYVKRFTTTWELDRLLREVEIDIMDLSNTLALYPDIEEDLKRELEHTKYLEEVIASYEARITPEEAKKQVFNKLEKQLFRDKPIKDEVCHLTRDMWQALKEGE